MVSDFHFFLCGLMLAAGTILLTTSNRAPADFGRNAAQLRKLCAPLLATFDTAVVPVQLCGILPHSLPRCSDAGLLAVREPTIAPLACPAAVPWPICSMHWLLCRRRLFLNPARSPLNPTTSARLEQLFQQHLNGSEGTSLQLARYARADLASAAAKPTMVHGSRPLYALAS